MFPATEPAIQSCFLKKLFRIISQYSQEETGWSLSYSG